MEWIIEAQTLEDLVDGYGVCGQRIVRCKDCKHYLDSNEKCRLIDTRLHFYETNKVWTEYCYCAWGEREEDETD